MSRLQLRNNPEPLATGQLTQQLTAEFEQYNNPDNDQEYHQPLISIEAALGRRQILVIWDAWRVLSQQERSGIIMQAFEATQGSEEALKVSIAMGLTQDEATQLGVDFVPSKT